MHRVLEECVGNSDDIMHEVIINRKYSDGARMIFLRNIPSQLHKELCMMQLILIENMLFAEVFEGGCMMRSVMYTYSESRCNMQGLRDEGHSAMYVE